MQNSNAKYSSSERTPIVLPEMEQLLPPLGAEQFSALEGDILENGCYAPIIVNEDKIAGLFCKAFERAVLLTPSEENVRLWVEGTRMRPDEIGDSVRESYELAQTFQTIGDILKNEILPKDWRITVPEVLSTAPLLWQSTVSHSSHCGYHILPGVRVSLASGVLAAAYP